MDPRNQGQASGTGQNFNPAYRQNSGQVPPEGQAPPMAPQYPSRGQGYPSSPKDSPDDHHHQQGILLQPPQQQQRPVRDNQTREPAAGQAAGRFGRGAGHVSGAKAILLPGPPFAGQGSRGRGRGRSDGGSGSIRGRGRNARG